MRGFYEAYKVTSVLLASLETGPNIKKIGKLLKIDSTDLKKYEKNLRKSKVWDKDKIYANWLDKEDGGISFWLDVSVAMGLIKRTSKKL